MPPTSLARVMYFCPQGPLCRAVKNSHVCSSVRATVRPTDRPSVTLIGSAPDLVTRTWHLPVQWPSSRPQTGPKVDDLVIGHDSSDLVTRIPDYHLISYFVRHSIILKFCTALHYGPCGRPLPCRSYRVLPKKPLVGKSL